MSACFGFVQDNLQPATSSIRVAGRTVAAWNDNVFSQLRTRHGVEDTFLETSLRMFGAGSAKKLSEGKGGSSFYMTDDHLFIVKELSDIDHKTLLRISRSYAEHLLYGSSVLSPIYLHFEMVMDPQSGSSFATGNNRDGQVVRAKRFIAMRHLMPFAGPWDAKYDLKGCADDKTLEMNGHAIPAVHKRIWNLPMWLGECAWTPARWTYYHGKVHARSLVLDLPQDVRDEVLRRIDRDCDWLARNGLMDYSLLLGVRRVHLSTGASVSNTAAALSQQAAAAVQEFSWCCGGELFLLSIGIIDFLQPWTAGKVVAMLIKSFERNKATVPPARYAARFKRHFSERLQGKQVSRERLSD
eukprot:TRINITY_DN23173_c1_g1_i4.p1 TRINITY_DN23173_c1_g1~~TRINITY_DN23173_c1_g1_i4.p1  ORF type:complete len:355 (-),score=63.26 TRINITY_DN23173_c1_g1_i4:1544-2608(-)